MKKLKTLFLCLGLSAMFAFAGCGKAPISSSVIETVEKNREVLITDIVKESDKESLINLSEEDYEIKVDAFEEGNLSFASQSVYAAAVNSCKIALDENLGEFVGYVSELNLKQDKNGYKASIPLVFGVRNVNMNITYDNDLNITDITFSPVYSMGEAMTKAGLNTLLGMGSVFCVLILIMFIIYLFGIIPKIQKKSAEKKAKKQAVSTETSVEKTIANIVEKEEGELVDDTELVAVISAAIAAYEGNSSTDGFVVRSIRKSQSKKWQNAQY